MRCWDASSRKSCAGTVRQGPSSDAFSASCIDPVVHLHGCRAAYPCMLSRDQKAGGWRDALDAHSLQFSEQGQVNMLLYHAACARVSVVFTSFSRVMSWKPCPHSNAFIAATRSHMPDLSHAPGFQLEPISACCVPRRALHEQACANNESHLEACCDSHKRVFHARRLSSQAVSRLPISPQPFEFA